MNGMDGILPRTPPGLRLNVSGTSLMAPGDRHIPSAVGAFRRRPAAIGKAKAVPTSKLWNQKVWKGSKGRHSACIVGPGLRFTEVGGKLGNGPGPIGLCDDAHFRTVSAHFYFRHRSRWR